MLNFLFLDVCREELNDVYVNFMPPPLFRTSKNYIISLFLKGVKPASLEKVKNPEVRKFIEKCIAKVADRLSARELLVDPFLQSDEDSGSIGRSLQPQSSNAGAFLILC